MGGSLRRSGQVQRLSGGSWGPGSASTDSLTRSTASLAKASSFQDGVGRNERAREAFGGVPGLESVLGSSRLPQEPEILSGPQNPVPTVRQTMGPGCAPLPATCGHTFPGAAEYTAVLPRPSESPALGPLLALTTGLPVDGCSIRGGRACRS